jgi:hypothetical protein
LPGAAGAVNVVPLTPVPDQVIPLTVVPGGNVALNVAVVPGHSVPRVLNVGAGTFATVITKDPLTTQPLTVALNVIV